MTIVVASGKGGTGKTTVSVGLAQSLPGDVSLLDCDVDAPNTHLFLPAAAEPAAAEPSAGEPAGDHGAQPVSPTPKRGARTNLRARTDRFTVPVPQVDTDLCTGCGACARVCAFGALAVVKGTVLFFDDLCHACGACTLVCPEGAITEVPHEIGTVRETQHGTVQHVSGELDVGQTLAPPLIRAVKERATAATTVIDAAPGTTCPVVEAARGADVGLLVTENTPFGLHDLELAAEVFAELGLPAGIVVNRSGIGYPDEARLEEISRRFGFPIVLRIPYSERIARGYAEGRSIVESDPALTERFRELHVELTRMSGGTS